jgi:hypothetical protein
MALKKQGQVMRRIKTNATPVPMPTRKPNRAPGSATPVPMPTREPNYGKGRAAKPKQLGPKKPPKKASGGEILGKVAKEVGKAAISPIIAAGRATTLPYRAANKVGKRAKNAAIPKRIVKRAGNGRMSAK